MSRIEKLCERFSLEWFLARRLRRTRRGAPRGDAAAFPPNARFIHGPPGSGKTTHVVRKATEAARLYGPRGVLIASLTRTAAAEVRARRAPIPAAQVGTLHSFAYRALGLGEGRLARLDGSPFRRHRRTFDEYTRRRAALAPRRRWPLRLLAFALRWEAWKRRRGLLDFEDLIDLAARRTDHAPGRPRVIYLDEAQDYSAADLRLIRRWAGACRAVVFAGDLDQSIYGFRGAGPELLAAIPEARRRVLGRTYRLPRAVHRYATAWIARAEGREAIAYGPRESEGHVRRGPPGATIDRPGAVVREARREASRGRRVMLLAPCGYMLERLVEELRDAGVPFHNPYKPAAREWNPLPALAPFEDFLRASRQVHGAGARPWTWAELRRWLGLVGGGDDDDGGGGYDDDGDDVGGALLRPGARERVARRARERPREWVAPTIAAAVCEVNKGILRPGVSWLDPDWPETLATVARPACRELVDYGIALVERDALFSPPRVIVGTIHSVKGGEADVVYVFPDLSARFFGEWMCGRRDEVLRMFYVAFTRAREELVLLDAAGERAVGWLPVEGDGEEMACDERLPASMTV